MEEARPHDTTFSDELENKNAGRPFTNIWKYIRKGSMEMDIMEKLANFVIKTGYAQSHLLLERILLITVLVKTYQEK